MLRNWKKGSKELFKVTRAIADRSAVVMTGARNSNSVFLPKSFCLYLKRTMKTHANPFVITSRMIFHFGDP